MRKVLDDDRLEGAVAAEVRLRSARAAWTVPDYEQATAVIELLCQLCGGAADILVPSPDPGPAYERLLAVSTLDMAVGETAATLAPGLGEGGNPFRRLPALLTMPDSDKDTRRTVEQALPDVANPWHLAYITALGSIGTEFNPALKSQMMLLPDLAFGNYVNFEKVTPGEPGVVDLLSRLERTEVIPPIGVATSRFTSRPARARQSALDGWLADREAYSRQTGSAIIVLYTPGNVADLCLTWNLRARHGWLRGLPLAVPFTVDGQPREQLAKEINDLLVNTGLGVTASS